MARLRSVVQGERRNSVLDGVREREESTFLADDSAKVLCDISVAPAPDIFTKAIHCLQELVVPTAVVDIYHIVHSMLTETLGALSDIFAVVVVDCGGTNTLVLIGLVRGAE